MLGRLGPEGCKELADDVACLSVRSSSPLKSYRYGAPHLGAPGWARRLSDIEACLPEGGDIGLCLQGTVEVLWLLALSRWLRIRVRSTGTLNRVPDGYDFGLGIDRAVRNCHRRMGFRPRALKSRRIDLLYEPDRQVLARELLAVEFLGYAKGIVIDESCAMHVHVSLPDEPWWEDYLDAMSGCGPAERAAQVRLTRAVDEHVRPCMGGNRLRMGDTSDICRRNLGRNGTETARFGDGFNYAADPERNRGFRAITEHETMEFRLGSSSWCASEIVSWLRMCTLSASILARSALGGGKVN